MSEPTSNAAWAWLVRTRSLGSLQALALTAVCNNPEKTGRELERLTGSFGLWKRLSELQKEGHIEEMEPRQCTVSGRSAKVWKLSAKMARALSRKAGRS